MAPAETGRMRVQAKMVWHRHSCLCLGKMQRLILLTLPRDEHRVRAAEGE
jgi:hypothetical protein